jgi:hypothetical protein
MKNDESLKMKLLQLEESLLQPEVTQNPAHWLYGLFLQAA